MGISLDKLELVVAQTRDTQTRPAKPPVPRCSRVAPWPLTLASARALSATSHPARASASAGSAPPAAAPVARAPAVCAARPLAPLDLGPALGHLRRPRLGGGIPTVPVLLEAPGTWLGYGLGYG